MKAFISIDVRPHHIDNAEGRMCFEWFPSAPTTDTVVELFEGVRDTFDLCPTDALFLVSYSTTNGHRNYVHSVDLYLKTTPFRHLVEKTYPSKFILLWMPGYNCYYKNPQDLRYPLGYGGPSCPIPRHRLIPLISSQPEEESEVQACVRELLAEDQQQCGVPVEEEDVDGEEVPSRKRPRHV